MLRNWRMIAKIVVAVLTALLGTVGATLADSVAPLCYFLRKYRIASTIDSSSSAAETQASIQTVCWVAICCL